MQRTWHRMDSGLAVRMFLVMFLLAVLYLGFVAVLWAFGVEFLPLLLIVGVLLGAQYYFSDQLVLRAMGARVVSPEQEPRLHGTIERLCTLADMPKPKVAVVRSDMPNAFATGRNPANAVVAVTTGLMGRLEPQELEGVLAHELSHIKNRDVTVITLASFFATLASFITQSMLWGGLGYGRRDRRDGGGAVLVVWLASILVWVISFFLIRALSRHRELAADRGGAVITGAPGNLASALVKISGGMARIPERDLRQVEEMNAFFIVPALRANSVESLLSTHPSLETRLDQLRRIEAQMEGL
ncbi:MAG: zinc metalloprotease HtpX [Chloroflexi bacterium]|nr:zinc metalloprotease HtpX [Chloroflexota bacterium]